MPPVNAAFPAKLPAFRHGRKCSARLGRKCAAGGQKNLFCAEDAVARVAEAGDDVAVLVEMIVERCDVDVHIRMLLLHHSHALRGADDAHELDVLAADFLHELHRGGRAAAGGEHGIDDDDVALGNFNNNVAALAL